MSMYGLEEGVEPIDKMGWVMDKIMQSIVETFESYGIELPEIRYQTVGATVHDCEQVTITNIQTYLGPPGDQAGAPNACFGPRTGVFQVEIVRCLEDGTTTNLRQGGSTVPDPETISNYAKSRLRDVWALLDASAFLPDYNAAIADAAVTDSQGRYQAVVMNLVVQI